MDSIFEEDADEVGGETEAYCPSPRCKADTTHTIISMYEDEVRRVQCVVCGEVHAYRKPRGDGPDGEGGDGVGKKSGSRKLTWDEAMARATDTDLGNCRPYSIRDTYEDGDVVHHPVFDIGFVVEQLPDNKVEVIFRDGGARILVHNRGAADAARMPEIAEVPIPREAKKKKRAKKPDAPANPVPARSKAEVEAAVVRARTAAQARMDESSRSAEERNKKMKADAKAMKANAKGAKAKPAAPPAKAAPAKPAKAAVPPAKAAVAKQPAKAAAKGAKKPAKPAKPAKKAPAKKPAKAAKKPAPKKKKK
jgi:hypothetical protein